MNWISPESATCWLNMRPNCQMNMREKPITKNIMN